MVCPNCGKEVAEGTKYCPGCWAELTEQPVVHPEVVVQEQPKMKWFKFLIYFGLFAGAVMNALSGIGLLTGAAYGEYADAVYETFQGLMPLDMLVGVILLALAAFEVVVRFRLAKYCKNGPKLLIILYVVILAVNLVYAVSASAILSTVPGTETLDIASQVSSTCTSVAMIVANTVYFKKRSHLFVND